MEGFLCSFLVGIVMVWSLALKEEEVVSLLVCVATVNACVCINPPNPLSIKQTNAPCLAKA